MTCRKPQKIASVKCVVLDKGAEFASTGAALRYGEHTISIGTDVPSSAIRLKSLSINRACLTVFALMISGIFQNSAIRSISLLRFLVRYLSRRARALCAVFANSAAYF